MSPLENPFSEASLTFTPAYSCSPEKATIAEPWQRSLHFL
jgi:hypothetical protein